MRRLMATIQDVISCYRLYLDREPDEAGLRHFTHLVSSGNFPTHELARLFSESPEALALRASGVSNNVVRVAVREGFTMCVIPEWNAVNREIAQTKTYEPHITRHVELLLKPGDVFVDVGANVGYYSMLAASRGAKVVAFEPGARNVWLLKASAEHNGFTVDIYPVALSDAETLVAYSPLSGNGQISKLGDNLPVGDQEVLRTRTLDGCLSSAPSIIKIDVEGAEALVLAGAHKALEARPVVFSEFSPANIETVSGVSAQDYLATFLRLGYRFYLCAPTGDLRPVTPEELEREARSAVTSFVDFVARP